MQRAIFALIGFIATALAIAGAILPGLPTVPFVLVALWAFHKSSERLTAMLERIPILRSALVEAHRFEQRRAIRPGVKLIAVGTAWASVAVTALSGARPLIVGIVVAAALSASFVMWWYPTESG